MPSKVSQNRPSVGRPQMESRARGAAEARKRHLPTPGNTRVRGMASAPPGRWQHTKGVTGGCPT